MKGSTLIAGFARALILSMALVVPAGCSSATEPITHVEVIASDRYAAPQDAWDKEIKDIQDVISFYSSHQNIALSVTPISDHSGTEQSFEILRILPHKPWWNSNEVLDKADATSQAKESYANMSNSLLSAQPNRNETEIIEAILAAGSRFASFSSPKHSVPVRNVLLVISSGFEQSVETHNFGDANSRLGTDKGTDAMINRLIDRLKSANKIADLSGMDVCMMGITRGLKGSVSAKRADAIKKFWLSYFIASHANLMGYGPGADTCNLLSRY